MASIHVSVSRECYMSPHYWQHDDVMDGVLLASLEAWAMLPRLCETTVARSTKDT